MRPQPSLTRWPHGEPPTDDKLNRLLRAEGLTPRWWSNGPGDRYDGHSHTYHKVLYCARGSIRFEAGTADASFQLRPGDRLEIPPGTPHSALVGPEGCSCVEADRVG
jgi:quercetin dioxygenase-like cupin family protein